MGVVSRTVQSLLGGVSQQPAIVRLTSQLEAQEDCYSSVVDGLSRRPPLKHVVKLASAGPDFVGAASQIVERDEATVYQVIALNGSIRVFDLIAGTEATVTTPDGTGYLTTTTPGKDLVMTTVEDYTFIANRKTVLAMTTEVAPARPPEALVFFRLGGFNESYTVTLTRLSDNTSQSYAFTTPANSDAGYEYFIKTNIMCQSMVTALNGGVFGTGPKAVDDGYVIESDGPLIRISRTDGVDFAINTADGQSGQHMNAFKVQVQSFNALPSVGWDEFTIKVAANPETSGADYYVKYVKSQPGQQRDTGYWTEVAAPGVTIAFDPATMPHALVSNSDGTFTFKEIVWEKRGAGDLDSVPTPTFVGKKINDIFFTRRRLGWSCGETVNLSRSGGQYFNFWQEKANQVLATDPIDIPAQHTKVAIIKQCTPFNQDVILWSGNVQFRMTSSTDVLSPNTVDVKPISEYTANVLCRPIVLGDSLYYASDRVVSGDTASYSMISNYVVSADIKVASSQPVSDHVPRYIPGGIVRLTGSTTEKFLAALSGQKRDKLYVWSFLENKTERMQSSWSRWNWPTGSTIMDIGMRKSQLIAITSRVDGLFLETVELAPKETDESNFYTVHLDRRLTQAQVTKSFGSGVTTFTLPYAVDPTLCEVLLVPLETNGLNGIPYAVPLTFVDATHFTAPGNYTDVSFFIGLNYASWGEFSEFFPSRGLNGVGDGGNTSEGTLTIHRLRLVTNETAGLAGGAWTKRDESEFGNQGPISISGLTPAPTEGGPLDAAMNPLSYLPAIPTTDSDNLTGTTVVMRRRGIKGKHRESKGEFRMGINKKASKALIRFQSVDHMPFHITGAIWRGNYSLDVQRI